MLAQTTQGKHLHSVVDFEIILGSQLVNTSTGRDFFRPTLRPYWIGTLPSQWGIPIKYLIDARYTLRHLPNKRQTQVRDMYEIDRLPTNNVELADWQAEQNNLLVRIDRSANLQFNNIDTQAGATSDAQPTQTNVGGLDSVHVVDRPTDTNPWRGSAVPDLFDGWDFLLDMTKQRADYEA